MKAEKPVEVDRTAVRAAHWSRDGNRRPEAVVRLLAVGDEHVERVSGAALKETNQRLSTTTARGRAAKQLRGVGGAPEKARAQAHRDERHRARLHEHASVHTVLLRYRR